MIDEKTLKYPLKCYGAWTDRREERHGCASGGFVSILSREFIKAGGIVFATRYDEDFLPVYDRIPDVEDLPRFKGSIYARSKIGDTIKYVSEMLLAGRDVLFVGLPCQIAGLKAALKDCPRERLFCVDLICHGVCQSSFLREELEHIIKKRDIRVISDIRFRSQDSYNYWLTIWYHNDLLYARSAYEQHFFNGFLNGRTLDDSCYRCQFARPERIGDITAGDFFKSPLGKNITVVGVNNRRAMQLIQQLKISEKMNLVEADFRDAVEHNLSLREPMKRTWRTELFKKLLPKYGYYRASRIVLSPDVYYRRLHHRLHVWKTKLIGK